MDREPTSSSAIAILGCEETTRTLEITFTSGKVYRYFGVDPETHDEFLQAPSKGAFFNARIRDQYAFEEIR